MSPQTTDAKACQVPVSMSDDGRSHEPRRRIHGRARLEPGILILTDAGLLGRVRRFVAGPVSGSPADLEVDDIDGGVAIVSARDVRLVYG